MVDPADIVALAPTADHAVVDALARTLRSRQRLLGAAVCRGGHLHLLTSEDLWVAYGSGAHVEASKDQIGGAVVMGIEEGEVRVAILAFSGLQPPHRFPSAEGLELARAVNELARQPPEGPAVAPLGPGRINQRPSSWRSPSLIRAGDVCDVTVVPDGIQLYFSSGDYPLSTVFSRTDLLGVLAEDKTILIFESHGEPLEVELGVEVDDVLAAIPGTRKLDHRPSLSRLRQRPLSGREAATGASDEGGPQRQLIRSTAKRADGDHGQPSDEPILTRDGTVIERLLVAADHADSKWAELARSAGISGNWPVILGNQSLLGDDELSRFAEDASSDRAAPRQIC